MSYSERGSKTAVVMVLRPKIAYDIQCLAKVFINLHFFHVLLCCCLMLSCFKLVFFHINLHSIHHIGKAKTESSQLRKLIINKKLK